MKRKQLYSDIWCDALNWLATEHPVICESWVTLRAYDAVLQISSGGKPKAVCRVHDFNEKPPFAFETVTFMAWYGTHQDGWYTDHRIIAIDMSEAVNALTQWDEYAKLNSHPWWSAMEKAQFLIGVIG